MPNLTVSLTTSQANRTRPAFAFLNEDGSPATAVQVTEWMKRQLRDKVRQYEQQRAGVTADANVDATLAAEGW